MAPFKNNRSATPPQGRTAAEREQARVERERRRAQPAEQEPSLGDSAPARAAPPPDAHDTLVEQELPASESRVPQDPSDDVHDIWLDDDPDLQETGEQPAVEHEDLPQAEQVADPVSPQPPLAPPAVKASHQPPPAPPTRPARTSGSREALLEHRASRLREHRKVLRGTRRMTRARLAALIALALAIALVWFLAALIEPFHGSGHGKVIVEIPKGSSSSQIGSILARDGVVSSGFFFDLRALIGGKRSDLHSGRYQLKLDMSYSAAIAALSKPPPAAIPVKIVIPEGLTRAQIAALASENSLKGSYLSASEHFKSFDPRRYGASRAIGTLEGFLFPATYELNAGAPAGKLVSEQLRAFTERFGPREIARARDLHETPYQLLTVASMIEREAQIPGDRAKIAAVIYNRLRDGMPLGIDATIYYAVEQQKGIATYTGELTEAQLHIDSPYNTRTHSGLPPTPISNPGMASIEAAAHPAHVSYLYYVAGADGCGEQVFSDTLARFETNVAAYRAAVQKNGGHPPTCKHK